MTIRLPASVIAAVWLAAGMSLAQDPPREAAKDLGAEIPNYLALTDRIGTGGQPSEQAFRLLAREGYTAVINLRTPAEGTDIGAEKRLAGDLGMQYFHIPVRGPDPGEEPAMEFLRVMKELSDQKVFVHCASGNRVGSFMMFQRVLQDGLPPSEAEAEAHRVGLRSEDLRQFARDVIERHGKKEP